jgi:O-antigen ligase
MKKELQFLNYIFYSIAFFILLPNRIKEIPFVVLSIFAVIMYRNEKRIDFKSIFAVLLFFFVNVLSLLYTHDMKYGLHRLEGILPFLYLGFSYGVFLKLDIRIEKKVVENWIFFFNGSIIAFLVIVFSFFQYKGITITYNSIRTVFDEIPLINMHPIYLSIVAVLGIMSCVFVYNDNKKKSSFFIFVNFILLFMTGAKAAFIGFFILLLFVLCFGKIPSKIKYIVLFISALLVYLLFIFNSDFKKRFYEMIIPVSYSKVNPNNSTSVRLAVWDCGFQEIKHYNIIIGNGIGDVPTILQQCYDAKYPELDKFYNTHNQYFSIILGTGLVGLISFLWFFMTFFIEAIKTKNYYLVILILFYLYMFNFENIIERKYGILLMLFFLFYGFNIFTKTAKYPVNRA